MSIGKSSNWDGGQLIITTKKATSTAATQQEPETSTIATQIPPELPQEFSNPYTELPQEFSNPNIRFRKGSCCRTVWDVDGLEYEAVIINNRAEDDFVIVKYFGYGNKQKVKKPDLKESRGQTARARQIENACLEDLEDREWRHKQRREDAVDDLMDRLTDEMAYPAPLPFPPNVLGVRKPRHSTPFKKMLMGWYVNGYYTGLYHGSANNTRDRDWY